MSKSAKTRKRKTSASDVRNIIPELVKEIESQPESEMSPDRQAKIAKIKAAIKAGKYSPDIMKVAESLERELYPDE